MWQTFAVTMVPFPHTCETRMGARTKRYDAVSQKGAVQTPGRLQEESQYCTGKEAGQGLQQAQGPWGTGAAISHHPCDPAQGTAEIMSNRKKQTIEGPLVPVGFQLQAVQCACCSTVHSTGPCLHHCLSRELLEAPWSLLHLRLHSDKLYSHLASQPPCRIPDEPRG